LSPRGREQARAVAERLAPYPVGAVYAAASS
ncbi:MAG: histidine phosphatase family protein, partial [Candidatus Bipolaricaulia bacterium]